MLTKTLLTLSLVAGSTFILNSYQPLFKTSSNPQQIVTQLPQQEIETIARNITVKVRNAENEGSGILIAKDDDTYTVITNASLTDGENYIVQTPDGMEYEAIVTGDNTENDLAILEFTSDEQYQTATIGNSDSITAGETVVAAGFPESKQELLVTEGKISLLTEKPLNKGYSIGFTNETVQGMSGGVLLNANGEVIGVLGKGKDAILDTAYDYADGTTPTDEEIATFREVAFSIPIQNIANLSPQLAALVPDNSTPKVAQTETPKQQTEYMGIVKTVDDIAQQITVRIATPEIASYGSGVIIAKDGNTYYVATVAHNFRQDEFKNYQIKNYQIITSDGESHQLDLNTVKKSDAYDFALFSFESDKDYTVATIGNYTVAANRDQTVFVSGFPGMYAPQRIITGGKVREPNITSFATKDSSSFISTTADRPGLLYSNISYGGMSGGAVLDSEGRLVGIHAGAENEVYIDSEVALGFSLGVPIIDILTFIDRQTPLKTEWLQTTNNSATVVNEDDYSSIEEQLLTVEAPKDNTNLAQWMNYGNQLWRYGRSNEAVKAFEQVITINPDYDRSYYAMSLASLYQKDFNQAVIALEKAIQINSNPYFYWRYLGYSHRQLKQYDSAIAAYQQAIERNPEDFVLYVESADVHRENQNYVDALVSYNRAISLNPNNLWAYYHRGIVYSIYGIYESALSDYNKAIEINPQYAEVYYTRGIANYNLEKFELAISDYNKAIEINPQLFYAYHNRGNVYYNQKEFELALSDFSQAIEINPQYVNAYIGRGVIYSEQGIYELALSDFSQAIEINPQFANAYYNRGLVYNRQRKLDLAISDYSKAIEINPQYVDAYYNRGLIYGNQRKLDLALSNFSKSIEINPQYARAYWGLGIVYVQFGNIKQAKINYQKAYQLSVSQGDTASANQIANLLQQLP